MALLTYTTYDEIRAALGVSDTELPDTVLALPMYNVFAANVLEDVHANLADDFAAMSALPSPTAAQSRFIDLVKLYVLFGIAKQLTTSLPLFSVSQLSDGRAGFSRYDEAYKDLIGGIEQNLLSIRYRLYASYTSLFPGTAITAPSTTFSLVKATGLAVNPVTNA
jgi:hypothetical protein